MTRDCYAILGVAPAAEDVVIGAAYRALMRHYHPDTNPDPDARTRASEITAAYALLRDPARRAAYDANRAAGENLWASDELPPFVAPRAAGRTSAIAASIVAFAAVAALWAWPPKQPAPRMTAPVASVPPAVHHSAPKIAHARPQPPVPLEPESERLADLRRQVAPSPAASTYVPDEIPASEPAPAPKPLHAPIPRPARVAAATPKAQIAPIAKTSAPPARAANDVSAKAQVVAADSKDSARLATLDRLSTGFYGQSLVNADGAKKQQLLSARGRFAAQRSACHSDSCLANTYLAHMREISVIMEHRAPAAKKR